jgi:O-antigen/teichoic acid export membrane protein
MGVYLTGKFIWGVLGLTVSWGLILFCFDMPNGVKILKMDRFNPLTIEAGRRSFVSLWSKCEKRLHVLKRLLWLALPLGLVMFLNSLNTNIPRYFIEHHLGSKQLGIFSAMAYLLVAGNTVVNSLGQSSSPRLAKYYAAGDSGAFRALLYKLIGIGIIIGAFGIFIAVVVGKEVLTLLYTPEFAVCGDVFVWLMIAAAVLYVASILNYGMMATRSFTSQLPLFALITVGSVAACAWLIPKYGLLGAALATLSAGLIQFAGSAWINRIALLKIQKG